MDFVLQEPKIQDHIILLNEDDVQCLNINLPIDWQIDIQLLPMKKKNLKKFALHRIVFFR